jgi:hypothetical protein
LRSLAWRALRSLILSSVIPMLPFPFLDGFVNSPISALRFSALSLRRT